MVNGNWVFHYEFSPSEQFSRNRRPPLLRNNYNHPQKKEQGLNKKKIVEGFVFGFLYRVLIECSDVSGEPTVSIFTCFYLEKVFVISKITKSQEILIRSRAQKFPA